MQQFTEEDISRIKLLLGYVEFPTMEPDTETRLQSIQDVVRYKRAMTLVFEIEALNAQIAEFVAKTFIVNVDGIQLNYEKVIANLKLEGTRKLKELAYITNLDVRYNPFGTGKNLSFTSIW